MHQTGTLRADLLLVTVTDSETDAVYAMLTEQYGRQPQTVIVDNRPYVDLGLLGEARVFLIRCEMGAVGGGASLLTIDTAIRSLSPCNVIMVGIAFGLRPESHQVGDVLVASKLMFYDTQRIGTAADGSSHLRARGERVSTSTDLLARCRDARSSWKRVPVHVGLMLSGEKLVDNLGYREQLHQLEPDAIGGEMEGAGLYAAARHHNVDWILVKAIADWADGRKAAGEAGHQELAARNAVAFVLHVIVQGGWKIAPRQPSPLVASQNAQASQGTTLEALPLSQLRQLLNDGMSLIELQTLCFDIGVDPEELPAENKSALVRELLVYLQRRKRSDALYNWLRANRADLLP